MSTHYKDYYGTHMPFGQFPKFGVLSSVKVLMTGTNIAGPFAASIMAEMGAQGCNIVYGTAPDKLYKSWMVYGAESLDLSTLMAGRRYWLRVDSFNENGVTEGALIELDAEPAAQ